MTTSVVRCWYKKYTQIVTIAVFTYIIMLFKIAQKVRKHWGYFLKTICHRKLSIWSHCLLTTYLVTLTYLLSNIFSVPTGRKQNVRFIRHLNLYSRRVTKESPSLPFDDQCNQIFSKFRQFGKIFKVLGRLGDGVLFSIWLNFESVYKFGKFSMW